VKVVHETHHVHGLLRATYGRDDKVDCRTELPLDKRTEISQDLLGQGPSMIWGVSFLLRLGSGLVVALPNCSSTPPRMSAFGYGIT